ncbi:MAG: RNA methyltransferase [Chloroflexi bacterium]|nr:RNA methyltransferase [Chloroflexota bacterium]
MININPLKWYKKLQESAARRQSGYFMAEGYNVISQIAAVAPDSIEEILSSVAVPSELTGYPLRMVSPSGLESILAAKTPQGIAALVKLPPEIYSNRLPFKTGSRVLLLDGVADPGNVGTLIRSAAALGYDGVILSASGCDVLSPKVVAASAGSLFSLWIRRVDDIATAAQTLKRHDFYAVATALDGQSDTAVLKSNKLLLILGSETHGVSAPLRVLSDYVLRLPVDNKRAESLNVAAAGAICMYMSRY